MDSPPHYDDDAVLSNLQFYTSDDQAALPLPPPPEGGVLPENELGNRRNTEVEQDMSVDAFFSDPPDETVKPVLIPLEPGRLDCSKCVELREVAASEERRHSQNAIIEKKKSTIHGANGEFYHVIVEVEIITNGSNPTMELYYIDLSTQSFEWVRKYLIENNFIRDHELQFLTQQVMLSAFFDVFYYSKFGNFGDRHQQCNVEHMPLSLWNPVPGGRRSPQDIPSTSRANPNYNGGGRNPQDIASTSRAIETGNGGRITRAIASTTRTIQTRRNTQNVASTSRAIPNPNGGHNAQNIASTSRAIPNVASTSREIPNHNGGRNAQDVASTSRAIPNHNGGRNTRAVASTSRALQNQNRNEVQLPLVIEENANSPSAGSHHSEHSETEEEPDEAEEADFNDPVRRNRIAIQRRRAREMTLMDLAPHFHRRIADAAIELDICATVLKRVCRDHGLERWPHRKVKAMINRITSLQNRLLRRQGTATARIQEEIDNLMVRRARVAAGDLSAL